MNRNEAVNMLDNLQLKYDELFNQYFELIANRKRAKHFMMADLSCECDSDSCHTEKRNQALSSGETDSFCHDDQDAGSVSISCLSGEIEVILYRAVWSKFVEYDRKKLIKGQIWNKRIDSADSWLDQTNRVNVLGHSDSVYNLDFRSWDS